MIPFMPPSCRRRWALALLILLGLAATAWARLDDVTFRRTAAQAKRVMGKVGKFDEKLPLLRTLAKDDTARATQVYFAWNSASHVLVSKRLGPAEAERSEAFDQYEAKLIKKHGAEGRDQWSDAEKSRYFERREAWKDAEAELDVETRVQKEIAAGVAKLTAADALAWLASDGVPSLLAERIHGPLLEACFSRMLDGPPDAVHSDVLAVLQRPLTPAACIRGLLWVGQHKPKDAALRLGPCLAAPRSPAVRRTAVKVFTQLDDPRSIPLLIEGLRGASGLPAEELRALLQRFTGQRFSAEHDTWRAWWKTRGETWIEGPGAAKRFDPIPVSGGVTFFGIHTPSKRIAFVLDRSGSMMTPAIWRSLSSSKKSDKKAWAGKTRLDVAKIQLARTIKSLASDTFFTVLFYDYVVELWREPPDLAQATLQNKADVKEWFHQLKPGGASSMFDALMKALEYAEDLDMKAPAKAENGAGGERIDTIFLLSDGAPTHFRGASLDKYGAIDKACRTFRTANGARGVVVHAIGVGQGHSEKLMRRIARESGGRYVAVGMD